MADSEDEELEDPKDVREEKMRNLVPALPADEWGSKTSTKPVGTTNDGKKKVTIADPKNKDDTPIKMRPPVFEPQEYDGVVSDSDDSDDDEPARQGSLGRALGDMNWAATKPKLEELSDEEEDNDDDSEGEGAVDKSRQFGLGDDIDEEMKRAVWGPGDEPALGEDEDDIDFDVIMEEDEGDFIKFAQDALGLTDDMMQGIVSSRQARGGELAVLQRGIAVLMDSFRSHQAPRIHRSWYVRCGP
jgi:hypothetical protein